MRLSSCLSYDPSLPTRRSYHNKKHTLCRWLTWFIKFSQFHVLGSSSTWENFLNIEQGVLDSAQYNDIDSPNQSKATQFKSRVSNIDTLRSKNNNLADSKSEHLTDNDFNTLKSYQTKLIDYLNALHDYATTYQTDNPVIQKADTPKDTKTEFQDELNESKQTFETAKNDWLTAYDSIMNQ